jgi:hypothetical protein
MAALVDADRVDVSANFQRDPANINVGAAALTKAQLKAAVDAVDDWAEANAAAFNTAIPQPQRGAMSTRQKTFLLAYVIFKRAGIL